MGHCLQQVLLRALESVILDLGWHRLSVCVATTGLDVAGPYLILLSCNWSITWDRISSGRLRRLPIVKPVPAPDVLQISFKHTMPISLSKHVFLGGLDRSCSSCGVAPLL